MRTCKADLFGMHMKYLLKRLTLVYHVEKSTSFFTPIAICTAPSILASSFSFFTDWVAGTGAGTSLFNDSKSTTWICASFDSKRLRYETSSRPVMKRVASVVRARTARTVEDSSMVESRAIVTLEKLFSVRARGETLQKG